MLITLDFDIAWDTPRAAIEAGLATHLPHASTTKLEENGPGGGNWRVQATIHSDHMDEVQALLA